MGINVDHIISATFAIGSALAAAAGILVRMYYNRIDPYMGMMPGFSVCGSGFGWNRVVPGTVLGGL